MSREKNFDPAASWLQNLYVALCGKEFLDGEAMRIRSLVAFWQGYRVTGKRARSKFEAKRKADLLDILLPALDKLDPRPFQLFGEAIDRMRRNEFPEHSLACKTLFTAMRLCVRVDRKEFHRMTEELRLKITESDFRRMMKEKDAPKFHRLLGKLKIVCAKDPRKGGRPRE